MRSSRIRTIAAAGVAFALTGCAGGGLGSVGDILGGVLNQGGGGGAASQQGELYGEIQSVDTQRQAIQVRAQNGETGSVAFDQNTVVVYQQQQYPVTALERGDVVRMQVQQVQQNVLYASRIDVQQSVQERGGQTAGGQLQQMYGSVGTIDRQNGFFELRTQQGAYTVVIPANAAAQTTERFRGLRSGENVSIEGVLSGSTRVDLYRFI